jgi:hypothetical protein
VDSGGGGSCSGVLVGVGGGSVGSGEGSEKTVDWGGISVVAGTSGEGGIVVVGGMSVGVGSSLGAGTPSAGGTLVGSESFTVDEGSFASDTGVSVREQSAQYSCAPPRNSDW